MNFLRAIKSTLTHKFPLWQLLVFILIVNIAGAIAEAIDPTQGWVWAVWLLVLIVVISIAAGAVYGLIERIVLNIQIRRLEKRVIARKPYAGDHERIDPNV